MSELSLGSWVTYANQVDVNAAVEMMAAAYDAGVNFFDNAEAYAGGDYDYSGLFRIQEITPDIAIDDEEIESRAREQLRVLALRPSRPRRRHKYQV